MNRKSLTVKDSISISEAASLLGKEEYQVRYMINTGTITSAEKKGWVWLMSEKEVKKLAEQQ